MKIIQITLLVLVFATTSLAVAFVQIPQGLVQHYTPAVQLQMASQLLKKKDNLAKQGILVRPGGLMNPMMFLFPLGLTAMMIPLMTMMFATLGGAFFGKRRRRDVSDQVDPIQWNKSVKSFIRVLDILEKALLKYNDSEH